MDKNEKEALVAECRASGITAKEWCEAKGIKYRSYVDWASKINKEKRQGPSEVLQWADVTITKQSNSCGEVKLICGKWTISVESGFSPTLLSNVLKVLDAVC